MPGTTKRPHLLYIAWGFPPCRSGGVYRALATVNVFAAAGWDVSVITADEATFERFTGADPSLMRQVDPRVTLHRVPFSWPVHETDLRHWSALRVRNPRMWRRLRNRLDRVPFPEISYGPWRRGIEAAARKLHAVKPVDLTMATANPNVDFAPALMLHRRAGVPYVMDYRDAWLLDVFSGDQLHSDTSRPSRWEARLIRNASEVWFVNEPIAQWHRDRYPHAADRIMVVANGYDPQFAPQPRAAVSPADRPLVFGYIGTVSGKVPIAEFLAGWRLARNRCPDLRDAQAHIHGYLGYYATKNQRVLNLLEEYAGDGVSYQGPVSKADIATVYQGFDALLLILGTGRYVTSGKAYEYIASGLPVTAIHDPGNAAASLFTGHPRYCPAADLEPESIARALERAAASARTADSDVLAAASRYATGYSRLLQLEPRVRRMAELVGGPGDPTAAHGVTDVSDPIRVEQKDSVR